MSEVAAEALPLAVGISLPGRYILLEDDRTLPIVSMLDANGQDTENPADCAAVIFERPDGKFGGTLVSVFDAEHHILASA